MSSALTDVWPCIACGLRLVVGGGVCRPCLRWERWQRASERMGIPPRFSWAAFGATKLLISRVARGAAAVGEAYSAEGASPLVFMGETGAGKTSLAVARLRKALAWAFDAAPTIRLLFASCVDLAPARSQHPLGEGEPARLRAAISAHVLLLDDLGANSARFDDVVTEVLHARHDAHRTTWITTGLSQEQIALRFGGAVERRVFEGATIIQCDEVPR